MIEVMLIKNINNNNNRYLIILIMLNNINLSSTHLIDLLLMDQIKLVMSCKKLLRKFNVLWMTYR